jgi:hypothetical protein
VYAMLSLFDQPTKKQIKAKETDSPSIGSAEQKKKEKDALYCSCDWQADPEGRKTREEKQSLALAQMQLVNVSSTLCAHRVVCCDVQVD